MPISMEISKKWILQESYVISKSMNMKTMRFPVDLYNEEIEITKGRKRTITNEWRIEETHSANLKPFDMSKLVH